jgi:hypothetical protein
MARDTLVGIIITQRGGSTRPGARPKGWNTLGGWHKVALETLVKLGHLLASRPGWWGETSDTVGHLRQRLSVSLVCDNMQMLLSCAPDKPVTENRQGLRGCRLEIIVDQDPCKSDLELLF